MCVKKSFPAALFTAAFSVLVFCPGLGYGFSKKDMTVSLKGTHIRDLSSKGLVLAFHVGLHNASNSPCALARYAYRVTVDQKEFLNLSYALETPIEIPAGEETIVALPVKVTYDLLRAAIGTIGEKCACDVVGEFVFTDERGRESGHPFAVSGAFPVFKDPEVRFPPIRVKDLTVGGADIAFGVEFGNPNSFDLIVDRIEYVLKFGETKILEGLIPGDKSIPAEGAKKFFMPLIMEFFEIGKDVYDLFQAPPVPCRLSGKIVVDSVWGLLTIPFDKTEAVALERIK